MHDPTPVGFTEVCSVAPIPSAAKTAICQVAENAYCPFTVRLNKMTLCKHPQSHLFANRGRLPHVEARPKTIMIVDHDISLMHLMASVLRNAGYEVMESDDGEVSLKVLEEWSHMHIDLVITDTQMHGILRQTFLDLRRNTQVLFVSNNPQSHIGLRANTPFLAKPFSSTALLRKVMTLLGEQKQSQPVVLPSGVEVPQCGTPA